MPIARRTFLKQSALAGAAIPFAFWPPIPDHPIQAEQGVSCGDVWADRAVIWSRADRPARMWVSWSPEPSFRKPRTVQGPEVLETSDFCGQVQLQNLPAGRDIYYQVRFQDLKNPTQWSEPCPGQFRSAPAKPGNVRFLWSGDTCGQGYGINPDIGGMRIYDTMRRLKPDFFIHSGDTIYADNPIPPQIQLPDGQVWKNIVSEAKSKVAETLDEFRGNYRYNLLDAHLRAFHASVPVFYQWDDHEVINNWYPQEILNDPRYTETRVAVLAERSRQAFLEYTPIPESRDETGRIYRKIPYGPLLDVFMLDMRTYRGPNGPNRQESSSSDTALLGPQQLTWLKKELAESRAAWKVIASDMPLGLIVYDDYVKKNTFENGANGNGPALGRELEIADLLRFLRREQIKNTVWFTADVHYTAAHYYDPAKARFSDFLPFYEFVSGPLNAGTFGPGELDDTFGPQVLYYKAPPPGQANLSPLSGMQFFGEVSIEGQTKAMQVVLRDVEGRALFTQTLSNEA